MKSIAKFYVQFNNKKGTIEQFWKLNTSSKKFFSIDELKDYAMEKNFLFIIDKEIKILFK